MRKSFIVSLLAATLATAAHAGEVDSYEAALEAASSTDGVAFLDFWTTWCGPCKAFDKALEEDVALQELVADITLVRIDAERGPGIDLARRYRVSVWPTFVAVNQYGDELLRWSGYQDVASFEQQVLAVLEDPRSLASRIEEFEANPTAELADKLAEIQQISRNYPESTHYLRRLAELDPSRAQEANRRIFSGYTLAFGQFIYTPWKEMTRAADAVLAHEDSPKEILRVVHGMRLAAKHDRNLTRYLPYLKQALAVAPDEEDRFGQWAYEQFTTDQRIFVDEDLDGAIADRVGRMGDGWETQVRELIGYTLWCADHFADLDRAERLLEEALAADLTDDAMATGILASNLADVRYAAGKYAEAVEAINVAIELVPGMQDLRTQREVFLKALEHEAES